MFFTCNIGDGDRSRQWGNMYCGEAVREQQSNKEEYTEACQLSGPGRAGKKRTENVGVISIQWQPEKKKWNAFGVRKGKFEKEDLYIMRSDTAKTLQVISRRKNEEFRSESMKPKLTYIHSTLKGGRRIKMVEKLMRRPTN